MDFIQFSIPQTPGETLAWLTALLVLLIGLSVMFAPRKLMERVGLAATRPDGLAEMRGALGGLLAGFALACLMLSPQPLLYFALGLALLGAVLGRLISIVVDKSFSGLNFTLLLVEALAAFFNFAYVFGLIA